VRFPSSVAEYPIEHLHFRLRQATFEIRRSWRIHTTPWSLNFRPQLEFFLDTCRTVREIEQVLKRIQSSDQIQALHWRRRVLADNRALGVGFDLAGGGSGSRVEKKAEREVTTSYMDSDRRTGMYAAIATRAAEL
jgi:hypothetical protein